MTIDDIGICKALDLEGNIIVGRLFQLDDRYYLYNSQFGINKAGNLSSSKLGMSQVRDDTICAYTYMRDVHKNKVFAFDVLKLIDEDKFIYVYWDEAMNMWLYITSWDSVNEESLNINELEIVGNMLFNDSFYVKFGEKGL